MQCIANYEIKSETSIILDDMELRLRHPQGLFKARMKNIVREDRSAPFRLALQLSFEAPSLHEAIDIGQERLADCLNMLAFTTGASFTRHRTKLIVDCTPASGMRECLVWADDIGHEDPQPILEQSIMQTIESLLEFDAPPAVRRALRWYRFGVNATQPEDQFQYFWFALEILAEHQKPAEKVADNCPKCKSPLYCETCKEHPTHRPYVKQAIRALIKAADKDCKEETIDVLDRTRNRLMHGGMLKEIEHELPQPAEDIVDVLGKVLFKAILHQFPTEMFKERRLHMAVPSTYVHRTMTGIAHISTVIPLSEQKEMDLGGLVGTTVSMVADGPPQSALPFVIQLTAEQLTQLRALGREKGDHRDLCERIYQKVQQREDKIFALVLATDMTRIQDAVKAGNTGEWQDLFREVITAHPPALYRPR